MRLHYHGIPPPAPSRPDVLAELISQHSYADVFLPDALRKFFSLIPAPDKRGEFLEKLLEMFSQRYLQCNPGLCMDKGEREGRGGGGREGVRGEGRSEEGRKEGGREGGGDESL